jgi:hypothetical protein
VPAEDFDVTAAIVMLVVAGLASTAAVRLFQRRDLVAT